MLETSKSVDKSSQLYESYAISGFGGYEVPLKSPRLRADFSLNYLPVLPALRDVRILDIGCGAGHFISWLADVGFRNVLGIDISLNSILACKHGGLENVEQIGDVQHFLATRVGEFDVITLNDVIEHFDHSAVPGILESVRHALRPSGRVLVKTLNMGNPGGLYLRYADFTHQSGFTETSIRQVLAASGFSKVQVEPYRHAVITPRRAVWMLAQRFGRMLLYAMLFVELGTDRPRILAKLLLAVAEL